jgi:hypothetical protein
MKKFLSLQEGEKNDKLEMENMICDQRISLMNKVRNRDKSSQ